MRGCLLDRKDLIHMIKHIPHGLIPGVKKKQMHISLCEWPGCGSHVTCKCKLSFSRLMLKYRELTQRITLPAVFPLKLLWQHSSHSLRIAVRFHRLFKFILIKMKIIDILRWRPCDCFLMTVYYLKLTMLRTIMY